MADYVIASVAETALMDVYPYDGEPNVKPSFPTQEKPNKDYSDRPNYRLYMSIQANLKRSSGRPPIRVRLVAVSKFHPNEAIEEAYTAGQRIFGESKVQEMTQKYETLPKRY